MMRLNKFNNNNNMHAIYLLLNLCFNIKFKFKLYNN